MKQKLYQFFLEYSPQDKPGESRRISGHVNSETMFGAERQVREQGYRSCGGAIVVHELEVRDDTGAVVVSRGSSKNDGKSSSSEISSGAKLLESPKTRPSTIVYATRVAAPRPIKGFVATFLGD
jgi:hypothetical protein